MKKIIVYFAIFGLFAQNAYPASIIPLKECENAAVAHSHQIKYLESEMNAAESLAESYRTNNYPSLVLEGSLKYVTDISELNGIKLGDNWNYSVGPAIYWTLFDGGVKNSTYQSAVKIFESKKYEYEHEKKQTVLSVRTAYFGLISALASLDMMYQQLDLALSQNRDVKRSVKSGIKTRLDEVLSDADVLKKQNQIKETQVAVTDNLKTLNELTGDLIEFDFDKYLTEGSTGNIFTYTSPKDVLPDFLEYASAAFDFDNPSVLSADALVLYYETLSKASINSNYPAVNIYAKTSIDYPNGPVIESYNQNTFGGSFSMPLYQFGKNKAAYEEKKFTAQSYEEKKKELLENLQRLFEYSKKKLRILEQQKDLNEDIIKQTKTAADLMFKSYMAGESKFLDVETMNFRVLEAQTNEINTYAQMLAQLAIIASLAK